MGVEGDTGLGSELPDPGQGPVQVGAGLDVDDHDLAAGIDIAGYELVGSDDHQVSLERNRHVGSAGGDDVGTEGQVGDEHPVHHVELDPVDPRFLEIDTLLAQTGEVGREDRRGDGDGAGVRIGHQLAD